MSAMVVFTRSSCRPGAAPTVSPWENKLRSCGALLTGWAECSRVGTALLARRRPDGSEPARASEKQDGDRGQLEHKTTGKRRIVAAERVAQPSQDPGPEGICELVDRDDRAHDSAEGCLGKFRLHEDAGQAGRVAHPQPE